jgi:cyanate lyase
VCPQAKFDAGVTFDEIAEKTGLTNVYVGQLFHQQV